MGTKDNIKTTSVSRGQRWLRRLFWALAALLVLWALLWAALPGIVKRQAEGRGSEFLGRKLSIGSIDFQPWSMELTLRDVALATADGSANQLSIARVYVDAEMQSLFRLAPVLDAVQIDEPRLLLTSLGKGRYDIDDLIARLGPKPDDPPSNPPRFAVYNVVLAGGAVDFVDRGRAPERRHEVRQLQLSVPFLSNLNSLRDVLVHPRLAFDFNGSHFDSAAEGTPFAQSRKGEATLSIARLDVTPYLPYLPAGLPVRLRSAVLDTDLKVSFVQTPQAQVKLTGTLKLADLSVDDAAGRDLLQLDALQVGLADVRPLEGLVKLSNADFSGLDLQVRRNASGRLNLELASSPGAAPANTANTVNSTKPAKPANADAAKTPATPVTAGPRWQVELESLALQGGAVHWSDETLSPAAKLSARDVQLQVKQLRWPLATEGAEATPVQLQGSLDLMGGADNRGKAVVKSADKSSSKASRPQRAAHLRWSGEGTLQAAQLQLGVEAFDLALVAPYVAQQLVPALQGVARLDASAQWKNQQLELAVKQLAVQGLALAPAAGAPLPADAANAAREWPSLKSLEVADVAVKLAERSVVLGRVALKAPQLRVRREANGRWMYEQWLRADVAPGSAPAESSDAKAKANAQTAGHTSANSAAGKGSASAAAPAPWRVSLGELQLDDGTVGFVDRTPTRPVFLEAGALRLRARQLNLDGHKPAPVELEATVRTARTDPGSVKFKGSLAWAPVMAEGALEVVDFPAHAAAPYVADGMRVQLQRAEASFKGAVRYAALPAGMELSVRGDAALEELRAASLARPIGSAAEGGAAGAGAAGEELLSWKALSVPGLELAMQPGQATRVKLREVSLGDFFARLVISPEGRLQVQDLMTREAPAVSAPATNSTAAAPTAAATAPAASAEPAALIDVGPITLINGRVAFSDRFIKPNYSAALTELNGRLSGFSSQPVNGAVQMADLELRGRAEGTASLEVTGRLNPLAKPLALDVRGRVRDLELSPLSAYAIKYAGYGIERGKLSMDVNYSIAPDGMLRATNKLVLNQLTFGDKVEGAPASLPVKLAVALLADRNGVIDLDLPISGSLNDPQFSIWPVVWKVVGNLITKALTAPFALFSGGGGGAEDLGTVAFVPGTASIHATGRQGLDQVAKTLTERPALRLTVAGAANLEAERTAVQRDRLDAMVLAEKRRAAAAAGKAAAEVSSVAAEEYPALLKEVYRKSDIRKPRNMVGLTKDLPVPEMEALLMASVAVNEDSVRELATSRGVAVRDYLAARQVPTERIFLGAGKTTGLPAGWKPSAELNLSSQ